jgi:hypothetical protein
VTLRSIFLAASSAIGAIPGVAVIIKGIGAPPDSQLLFGGIIEAFGALSLLILWLNRRSICRMKTGRVTRWSILLGVFSLTSLAGYILMCGACVKRDTNGSTYLPLWLSGDLKAMVERAGSRDAAIQTYGVDAVHDAIRKEASTALPQTTLVLLAALLAGLNSLTVSFGLIGLHEGAELADKVTGDDSAQDKS